MEKRYTLVSGRILMGFWMVEMNHRKKYSSPYPKSCNIRSMEELKAAFKISKAKFWLYLEE